ncbi:metallophosphoesterase family protein [Dongia deserti]|uniref:metallophosphoesterase family protein n=1 Tax=Dongia deserti TaxID=2268030 RepID=UPI000E649324|nr:metallophosphoesterase family protein [Dongia deserti]
MRVHVFSDLHLEFGAIELAPEVRSGALAELVLLAGDIDVRRRATSWAAETFAQHVAMIGGNHEGYGDSLFAMIAASRDAAGQASRTRQQEIRFLERETWALTSADGTPVRIIAATLWTDFALFGPETRSGAMAQAHLQMNDFYRIEVRDEVHQGTRCLEPMDVLRLHSLSRQFLTDELSAPFEGITIVMTHHAPSAKSLAGGYRRGPLAAAYASDLDALIEHYQPALWVHGHIHQSADYHIGQTRVVCNPRGYTPDALNPDFDPILVVEVS